MSHPEGARAARGADVPAAPHRMPRPTWLAAGALWLVALALFALAPRARDAARIGRAEAALAQGDAMATGDGAGSRPLEGPSDEAPSAPDGAQAGSPGAAHDVAAVPAVPSPVDADAAAATGDGPEAPSAPSPAPATATPAEPTEPPATETPAEPTVPPPTETPAPPPLAADVPVLPAIDGALLARMQAIWADGQARGRRGDVLAKVGDSLTVSGFFLTGLGCDTSRLGDHEDLRPLIDLYRAAVVPEGASVAPCAAANPLTRRPVSAEVGWLTSQVFAAPRGGPPPECAPPDDSALRCEVALVQPSIAIVTLGTNDVHMNSGLARYDTTLGRVVDELVGLGVIPLLSTLPPRTDRAAMAERTNRYNDVVLAVARDHQVPLVNVWRDLQEAGLANGGMEPDGIHLNAVGYGASFTEGGLRYGQNRRNLRVLEALAKVRRAVVEGGGPDG